jgi:uroporphyrin-III C-methyltransferase
MTVYLVGAGPGDPDLLTVRAARLLAAADVVVHDALVDEAVLGLASRRARLIDVGKRPGSGVAQDEINATLIAVGQRYPTVVRLKGGDPYVFGRGGEEAVSLAAAGIACEVVPGVSSAFAAPAAAGIPVTHRGIAPAVTVVTGHRVSGETVVDWATLGRAGSTLVVVMGMSERRSIAQGLIGGGLNPSTPVAIIEQATRAAQRVMRGCLRDLADLPGEAPATIVIGAVAAIDAASYPSSLAAPASVQSLNTPSIGLLRALNISAWSISSHDPSVAR